MNILVTGNAGLLGSNLVNWITENQPEHNIVGIDNMTGGYQDNINENITHYYIDLQDQNNLDCIFKKHKFDIVYHFAAYAAEGLSPFIRCFNYENNLVTTANIINNCIKYNTKRLVFTSSMATYGSGNPPFDENDVPQPIDPYGIAKYSCEMDIKVANTQHNLEYCIIRPHNVYGEMQNIWDKYRNVLGIWMNQHINNKPLTIFGDGSQLRAFSYIGDMVPSLWKAGISDKAKNEIINLGGIRHYSIKEAAEVLIDVMGAGTITYLEGRHEVNQAYSTHQKSVDLLDYKDNTTLIGGLTRMWEWAEQQPSRKQFVWSDYEISKGIYDYWK